MTGLTAPWAFDAHTAVNPVTGGAEVTDELGGFLGASGGYVAALALRALENAVEDPDRRARAFTVQLLRPVEPGLLSLAAGVDRRGRSTSAASVRVVQRGEVVAQAFGTFGLTVPSLSRTDVRMPDVPPPSGCEPLGRQPVPEASMGAHVERRPAGPLPLSGSDDAEILVWMRLGEDRPVDLRSAVFLADAAVPGTMTEPLRMPSVEIAVHVPPAPAVLDERWVLGVFRNGVTADGYVIEDGELWTPGGELLLQTRQLRRILD